MRSVRARDRRVQIRQPLHYDVLPVFERDGARLLAVLLQRHLALLESLGLEIDPVEDATN